MFARRGSSGNRRGGRGAGGAGRGRGGAKRGPPPKAEDLDAELDAYRNKVGNYIIIVAHDIQISFVVVLKWPFVFFRWILLKDEEPNLIYETTGLYIETLRYAIHILYSLC